MIACVSKINIFEENEIFSNALSKFGLCSALFIHLDISFSFFGRNAYLLCLKSVQIGNSVQINFRERKLDKIKSASAQCIMHISFLQIC